MKKQSHTDAPHPPPLPRPGHAVMLARVLSRMAVLPTAAAGVGVAVLLAGHWALVGVNHYSGRAIEKYTAPANAYVLTSFARLAGMPVERVAAPRKRSQAELEALEATLALREQDIADASAMYTAAMDIFRKCKANAAYNAQHGDVCRELATAATETELKKKVALKD